MSSDDTEQGWVSVRAESTVAAIQCVPYFTGFGRYVRIVYMAAEISLSFPFTI